MANASGQLAGHRGPWAGRSANWWATWLTCIAACRVAPTTNPTTNDTPSFDGERTLATLQQWLGRTRRLGDPDRTATIDALEQELVARGATRTERIVHVAHLPREDVPFTIDTVVGHFGHDPARRFVLATHFDTRPWADEDDPSRHDEPVPGANDGTSGLAVVLELASSLPARLPADVGFSVVLFDGEELGRPGDLTAYCAGSRHLVGRIAAGQHPELAAAELGIVLDMVGDADLRVVPEAGSRGFNPALVDHVWNTAEQLGITAFDGATTGPLTLDDHSFLSEAGIPSVLVIDRDYPAWHRVDDAIDRVSAASLAAVGTVVLESLVRWFAQTDVSAAARPTER